MEQAADGVHDGAARFDLSRREVPQLLWRESAVSTNTELVQLAAEQQLPEFTTLITTDQTAGRGRLDRVWTAQAGTSIAISILVRAESPSGYPIGAEGLGWLPLAAGVAMFEAVASVVPSGSAVGIKWPNDVQIDGRKVCGILSELVPYSTASPVVSVVIGAGLNVMMTAEQLPVPSATSLELAGARIDGAKPTDLFDRVLATYLRSLRAMVTALWQDEGDADRSGLRVAVLQRCTTIGRDVRVELPGGAELLGRAVGIDAVGRLEVRDRAGQVRVVAAGDIVHLR